MRSKITRIVGYSVAMWGALLMTNSDAKQNIRSRDGLRPANLRCEYRVEPLGIDAHRPRLSWGVESAERCQMQTAYQIQVASDPRLLKKNSPDLWDSGKVDSAETIQAAYGGKPLEPRMRCYWRVRVWDKAGRVSAWSKPATWEMGLLEPGDWEAQWINDGKPAPERDEDFYRDDPAPLFRKEFPVRKRVARARLYICGLGYYEAFLNGDRVGDHRLDPGWTTYGKRALYSTYDVTSRLRKGQNGLGVMLGNGWYNPLPMRMWGWLNLREHLAVGRPRLLAQLFIEYADGSSEIIVTDDSWKVADGPILRNSIYLGEVYDARKEQPGWDRAGFDDSLWRAAASAKEPVGALRSQSQPPIKITATLKPVAITEPSPGVFIFDMGRNFAGWARLRVKGPAGTKVQMRFGELLHPDGTLNAMTSVCGQIKAEGRGGPGAPALADQKDIYILKGRGTEVYTPRFTFHGFRYVELTGYPGRPTRGAIEGLRLNAAVEPAGAFECSNEILNRIQEMVQWTFLSNLFSVQSDCPHREKFGYGGDIVATGEAFIHNFDMATFYGKAVSDLADAARPGNRLTETAPYVGIADEGFGEGSGPIGWTLAYPYLQWMLYQYYGDRQIIADHYETTRRHVEFLRSQAEDHLIDRGISDHESLDPKPVALTGTAFYYHHVELLAKFAEILGRTEDARHYSALAAQVKEAFINRFLEAGGDRFDSGTQACQAFALYFDLVPPGEREAALKVLEQEVLERHQGHLATGIFGTRYLLRVLSDLDRAEIAYGIAAQKDFPGWGHMLANGATTLWEHWEFSDNTYSHNHPMFGSVSAWFFETLAGIRPDSGAAGFDRILIKPAPVGDLKWARARYDSVRGRIESEWRLKRNTFSLDVTLPANTTATVYVPARREGDVTESGKLATEAEGVRFLRMEDGAAVYQVGSGRYRFASRGRGAPSPPR